MLPFTFGILIPQIGFPVVAVAATAKTVQAVVKQCRGPPDDEDEAAMWGKLNQKVEQVTLSWSDLVCTLKDKTGSTKTLLDGVSGTARPGRLVAIMGPSGAGKTTLLNALAGQVPRNGTMTISGEVLVNEMPANGSNHRQAYVQQEDAFYSMMTVRETLTMAAELRLPKILSSAEKASYVDKLLAVLGLTKVANTRVGDEKRRGLSGGERKRLSLGVELIGRPSILFLDEPTTGLDAAGAEKVMSTLKSLASAGHTVVCSIHQPRSSIWGMFDDLVLLHEGSVVYSGEAGDKALQYFESQGHKVPEHVNPAEFMSDLLSTGYGASEGEDEQAASAKDRVDKLVRAWRAQGARIQDKQANGNVSQEGAMVRVKSMQLSMAPPLRPRLGWVGQFKLLASRSWKQVTRDKVTTIARLGSNISSAVVFGAIYFRMGRTQSSIQDRLGLLQVTAVATAMNSMIKTLTVFPRERNVVNRERAKNAFHVIPYLTGKTLAELPISALFPVIFGSMVYPLTGLNPAMGRYLRFLGILTLESFSASALGLAVGAAAPSPEAAVAIGPAVMLIFIVFGGLFVNQDSVPAALKWLPKASLIKQSFEALVMNEFQDAKFEPTAWGGGMTDGDEVLSWLSFQDPSIDRKVAQQARILMFFYTATWGILRANKPRFQPLLPPRDRTANGHATNGVKEPAQEASAKATPTKGKKAVKAKPQVAADADGPAKTDAKVVSV